MDNKKMKKGTIRFTAIGKLNLENESVTLKQNIGKDNNVRNQYKLSTSIDCGKDGNHFLSVSESERDKLYLYNMTTKTSTAIKWEDRIDCLNQMEDFQKFHLSLLEENGRLHTEEFPTVYDMLERLESIIHLWDGDLSLINDRPVEIKGQLKPFSYLDKDGVQKNLLGLEIKSIQLVKAEEKDFKFELYGADIYIDPTAKIENNSAGTCVEGYIPLEIYNLYGSKVNGVGNNVAGVVPFPVNIAIDCDSEAKDKEIIEKLFNSNVPNIKLLELKKLNFINTLVSDQAKGEIAISSDIQELLDKGLITEEDITEAKTNADGKWKLFLQINSIPIQVVDLMVKWKIVDTPLMKEDIEQLKATHKKYLVDNNAKKNNTSPTATNSSETDAVASDLADTITTGNDNLFGN